MTDDSLRRLAEIDPAWAARFAPDEALLRQTLARPRPATPRPRVRREKSYRVRGPAG